MGDALVKAHSSRICSFNSLTPSPLKDHIESAKLEGFRITFQTSDPAVALAVCDNNYLYLASDTTGGASFKIDRPDEPHCSPMSHGRSYTIAKGELLKIPRASFQDDT